MTSYRKMISVIIPVYNMENYLSRCMDSVLANSYRNLEIICVNDGSKDNSLAMLEAYAEKDSRIRIIDKPNGGLCSARNAGFDASTGDYVIFIDSDDWVHERFFETLIHIKEVTDAPIAVSGFKITSNEMEADADFDLSKQAVEVLHGEDCYRRSHHHTYVWNRLYDRDVLKGMTFDTQVRVSEDLVFFMDMLTSHPDMTEAYCDVPVYYYYMRGTSLTHSKKWWPHFTVALGLLDVYDKNADHEHSWLVLNDAVMTTLESRESGRGADDWKELGCHVESMVKKLQERLEHAPAGMSRKRVLLLKMMLRHHWIYVLGVAIRNILKPE